MKPVPLITSSLLLLLFHLTAPGFGIAQPGIPSAEQQIRAAVSPAPEAMRDNASVLGYRPDGELVLLRDGTNELICLADDPSDTRFHTSCYHEDLEPFMARGRELKAQGYSSGEVREMRRREIEDGTLPMPEKPMSLYSLTGGPEAWDYQANELRSARPLYVVYISYATVETTGLSTSPASEGAPWLMDPGKPWAHIMIGTGRELGTGAVE